MSRFADRLEEYDDGLLDPRERAEFEAALAADPDLAAELERVRRFRRLLHAMREGEVDWAVAAARRRILASRVVFGGLAAAAGAAIAFLSLRGAAGPARAAPPAEVRVAERAAGEWRAFGRRLGRIAAERRSGRLPRTGLGDAEPPPAVAAGVVFGAALEELGVKLPGEAREHACELVRSHAELSRRLGTGLAAEWARSEAALALYRELTRVAGRAVADAFYDVYRPGLADLHTAAPVPGDLSAAVARETDPETGRLYAQAYEEARAALARRYGDARVSRVLARLAPEDRRDYFRDASQDGVGRDAVLSIRARMYRAAVESGAGKLYVRP